jgi:hypothetical protein
MEQEQGCELDTSLLYQKSKYHEHNSSWDKWEVRISKRKQHVQVKYFCQWHIAQQSRFGGASITKPNKEQCSECSGATPWVSWMIVTWYKATVNQGSGCITGACWGEWKTALTSGWQTAYGRCDMSTNTWRDEHDVKIFGGHVWSLGVYQELWFAPPL